ncbi:hypothetical protein DZF91_10950 [Actinomadura logoneensis]|uniref:Uncharacterized protein n=1 Tax=Actinomadura logoneensis TaxID=2293572 RepID=A0A372JNF7_9ACTN|nr:hypothetical protein DZF91_10950 [Actinomadura logoneensis]
MASAWAMCCLAFRTRLRADPLRASLAAMPLSLTPAWAVRRRRVQVPRCAATMSSTSAMPMLRPHWSSVDAAALAAFGAWLEATCGVG